MNKIHWLLRITLLPFSLLYGLISELRNLLYDLHLLKCRRFPVPIVSVGNLTVGGTGKTPVVIWLAEQLLSTGRKVAIISRGYGRSGRGYRLVSDGQKVLLPVMESGDEMQLLARKLPGAIVAVSENRASAIDRVINEFAPQIILLDDAFQRRDVYRDWNIMLWNARDRYYGNLPIPSGTLREWHYRRRRADVFFCTRSAEKEKIPSFLQIRPVYRVRETLQNLVDRQFKSAGILTDLTGQKIAAFAGIAHPEIFKSMLEKSGIELSFYQPFPDHYRYKIEDIERLWEDGREKGVKKMLCTEKDMIKITELNGLTESGVELMAVAQKIEIIDHQKILNKLKILVDTTG